MKLHAGRRHGRNDAADGDLGPDAVLDPESPDPTGELHVGDEGDGRQALLAGVGIERLQQYGARVVPRPEYRPLTKFEQRGLRLGHNVWDLVFKKNN